MFPFSEFWWIYALFTLFVISLLVIDLGVFHRKPRAISFREATILSAIWIFVSLCVNGVLYAYALDRFGEHAIANRVGLEFLTGYLIEKALSVDNIFVFVVGFSYFGVPHKLQHRVLFYGILGALVFRAIFIALGAALFQFQWVLLLFGALLIVTGAKLMFASDKPIDPESNLVIRWMRRHLPITERFEGPRFFVRRDGVLFVSPLLLALVFLELTDIVFAIDSVPAIFAVTKEPMIVFTSNICAILGLRSLYFLLASAADRFHLLKYGLSLILIFVGLKMVWLNDFYEGKFPIGLSLGVIGAILLLFILLSLMFPKPATAEEA